MNDNVLFHLERSFGRCELSAQNLQNIIYTNYLTHTKFFEVCVLAALKQLREKNWCCRLDQSMLNKTFNCIDQIDIIDMQSLSDGEYMWTMMVNQDHFN